MEDISATTETPTLLDDAIQQMEEFLYALREGNESLEVLGKIPPMGDILPPPRIPAGVDAESWQIGIFGHGIQSLRFYCHWESRRLSFDFLLPYERVLASPERYQSQRKSLTACGFLALSFLLAEKDCVSYSPNDAEAGLRVKCDNDELQYVIHNGETILRQGDDWRDLESMLDCRNRAETAASMEDMMIFVP